ncbi:hypothetical protein AK812_SmicGene9966 [Symbiodinium microadriaticum]|uniref:Uncharacterized protein n=1 Tax=Symbiodinium microadriaticum TaxID=2951 RepID=A0A1Q9EGZ0_SYMMI|nr:hypothetical protein AK812_SmicGene9966 [Symbiodinium microadriaticum]
MLADVYVVCSHIVVESADFQSSTGFLEVLVVAPLTGGIQEDMKDASEGPHGSSALLAPLEHFVPKGEIPTEGVGD